MQPLGSIDCSEVQSSFSAGGLAACSEVLQDRRCNDSITFWTVLLPCVWAVRCLVTRGRPLSRSLKATLTYRKKRAVARLLKMMLQKYRVQCRSRFYLSFLNSALKYWLESGIKRHLKRKGWGLQRLYGPGQLWRPVWEWCILSPGAAVVIYG